MTLRCAILAFGKSKLGNLKGIDRISGRSKIPTEIDPIAQLLWIWSAEMVFFCCNRIPSQSGRNFINQVTKPHLSSVFLFTQKKAPYIAKANTLKPSLDRYVHSDERIPPLIQFSPLVGSDFP